MNFLTVYLLNTCKKDQEIIKNRKKNAPLNNQGSFSQEQGLAKS